MSSNAVGPRAPVMALGTLSDPRELGHVLAASGYFADARDAAQAVVKVLAGAELGFGPIASMTGVYIVKGRVTLSANLIAAAIKRHPRYDYRVVRHTNELCELEFSQDGKAISPTVEFSMADARTAGLANGENWRKYPKAMTFARALTAGARYLTPDVFAGAPVYTPEELGVDVDGETDELLAPPPAPRPARRAPAPPPPANVDHATGEIIEAEASETAPVADVQAPVSASQPSAEPIAAEAPAPDPGAIEPATVADLPMDTPATPAASNGSAPTIEALRALLTDRQVPESMFGMAMMAYDVDEPEQLSEAQLAQIMADVERRFPA